jgi:hypothetical protein
MMLEPGRAAALVAERLRRPPAQPAPDAATAAAGEETTALPPNGKDWLVQRTLEELGIHCEATDALQDLKGFLIASPRGAEIVVSQRLDEEERLALYAHLLAHALLEESPDQIPAFYSRLEYVEGREPKGKSGAQRRADTVADALAKAILRGRLDGAPQYVYRRARREEKAAGLRPALGRLVLDICHRASLALFWHSPQYQRLRSRPEMAILLRRLERLVRVAYAC